MAAKDEPPRDPILRARIEGKKYRAGGRELPVLDRIDLALGVREIVIGMPHRGRLNVLAQVMAKPHRAIFHEFKGGSASPDEVE